MAVTNDPVCFTRNPVRVGPIAERARPTVKQNPAPVPLNLVG